MKEEDSGYNKFSKWQCDVNMRHPLICQITTRVIAGLLIAGLCWLFVSPKPTVKVEKISVSEARVIINNKGFLPATDVYKIASGPTVALKEPEIVYGKEHSVVANWSLNSFKVDVKELPRNQRVIVNFATADQVENKILGDITVTKEK